MLVDELRDLPKSTAKGVSGDGYLLLACLDRIRVERASFEVGKPQLGWSSLVAVRGAKDDFHVQMADTLTSFGTSMV